MNSRRRHLLIAAAAAALGPGVVGRAAASGHPLANTIWDLHAGSRAGAESLIAALRRARYRLLGEVHDNPLHHAIRRQLLAALGEGGLRPAVAFEQFDHEHDAALQSRLAAGGASAEDVALAVRFNRKGWNWDYYRPLVETALRYRMALRAANLSRTDAARIARQPAAPAFEPPWSGQKEARLREIVFESHCRALPERMVPGMAAAQRARDSTLARALLETPRDGAVLIAGNGHVRRDLAVPLYLPEGASLSLGLIELDVEKQSWREYSVPYDFAWFTSRAPRENPCTALRR